MKITFLGGVGTVTGSKYLIEDDGRRILVDCGLFEGPKTLRLKNWQPFPVDPVSIVAVLLTHAHLDHSGYLPRLVQQGFAGPIICTGGTRDLSHIILKDYARLMEEEADYCNRHHTSKHTPARPLYNMDDVESCLKLFRTKPFGKPFTIGGLSVEFNRSGHILGSTHLRLTNSMNTRVSFSGNIGRPKHSIMRPPEDLLPKDYLVVESTYGDWLHSEMDPKTELQLNIIESLSKGGSLLIPAFSAGRTQQLLYNLYLLKKNRESPRLPVFLDSPMASDITHLYCAYHGDHIMDEKICAAIFDDVYFSKTQEESRKIGEHPEPKIIISACGMATGGRVLHHLKRMAPDERNTILFTGFQAAGTRGAALVEQAPFVKIHGEYIKINAKVVNLKSFSAHADYSEILTWLGQLTQPPRGVFVIHGEPHDSLALSKKIKNKFGWNCSVPYLNQTIVLEDFVTRGETYGIHN